MRALICRHENDLVKPFLNDDDRNRKKLAQGKEV